MTLAQFDAETRFLARAARGSARRGLALLDKLDQGLARSASRRRTSKKRGNRSRRGRKEKCKSLAASFTLVGQDRAGFVTWRQIQDLLFPGFSAIVAPWKSSAA